MATSSITANFYCDDAKAANAFVRLLAQPVKVIRKKADAVHAHEFANENEKRAFFLKTVEVARKAQEKRLASTRRRKAR